MIGKTKKIKSIKKPALKKEHFEVLLENMNDSIQLIAEGQMMFREEVGRRFDESDKQFFEFQNETRANFKELFDFREETKINFKELFKFKDETNANFKELFKFRDQTNANFKELFKFKDETGVNFKKVFNFCDKTDANFEQVFKRLSSIENELGEIKEELKRLGEGKVEKQAFLNLENRVVKLERELQDYKILIKDGK